MKELMNYLAKAEGTEIHRNSTESDITTGYGIYRAEHPKALIFEEIDIIASHLYLDSNSKNWSKSDLALLNKHIHQNNLQDKLKDLATDFYKDYMSDIKIDSFPPACQVAVFSMYTNGPLLAVKSIQDSINTMNSNGFIDYIEQSVDGVIGSKTLNGIIEVSKISEKDDTFSYLFEQIMLLNMSRQYSRLAVAKPDKYLKYLNGWENRLQYLSRTA